MGLRGKERLHGQRSPPGSEWFQPETGHPSSVFLNRGEPLWLIAGLVRLREGLWEPWTPLLRSHAHLLAPKAVRRERIENCMSGWPVSQNCPRLMSQPEPREHSNSACFKMQLHIYIFHTLLSLSSFWDPYKVNAGTLDVVLEIL